MQSKCLSIPSTRDVFQARWRHAKRVMWGCQHSPIGQGKQQQMRQRGKQADADLW